ncbi:MAG: hypothetical protein KUG56_04865 [Kordiimonadaceae bacterium]|nr:hypothetical protein [Kordiimonadaceae bacterium]
MAGQEAGLHDIYQQVKAFAYGIWRKRWYGLITAWLISLAGWGLISTMPYKYEANARIFVDTETVLPTIARNLGIEVDTTKKVEAIRRTLVTRPNLEKVIRRSDYLDRLASNEVAMTSMVASLKAGIRIQPMDEGIYSIKYETDDVRLSDRQRAEVAKDVVNTLLSFFLERSSGTAGQGIRQGQEFLEQNVKEYADRLSSAESAHAKFMQDNLDYIGGNSKFLTRLTDARTELRETRSKISELKVLHQTLQEQLKNVPATTRSARSAFGRSSGTKDPLEERMADLQKKLDALKSLGFKGRHPDIQNVSRQLAAVQVEVKEKQAAVAAELEEAATTGRSSTLTTETPNRLYEQLMLENIQTLAQVKTMEQREQEQLTLSEELEEKAKKVPEIAAQESALKRDYNLVRKTYNKLLKQKQDLSLRAEVEGADEVSFKVIENPIVPQQPSGPNRVLFMSAAFIGALVSGVGVSLVFSLLKPVIITVEQLRSQFDLNVLGNVTRSFSEQETRQRNIDMLQVAAASAGLFVVFGIFLMIDILGG